MKVLPYGRDAFLVEPDDPSEVLAFARAAALDGDVVEAVPAACTVLLRLRSGSAEAVRRRIDTLDLTAGPEPHDRGEPLVLPVVYDGADLESTAAEVGLDADGLVRAHTAVEYIVAFCGFAPGFAYLRGLDPRLHVRRLAEPRTRVPAGSVAIAGEFTGIYPRSSPGGWRLLGRTEAPLWDLNRDLPALLTPGTAVRFRAR